MGYSLSFLYNQKAADLFSRTQEFFDFFRVMSEMIPGPILSAAFWFKILNFTLNIITPKSEISKSQKTLADIGQGF